MKIKRYIFHHFKFGYKLFKLLYKLPYYKLLSYVFLGLLLSYALIDVINFLFWGLHTIFNSEFTQGDFQHETGSITKIISGHWLHIFATDRGNVVGFSYVLLILNIIIFHGAWWFNGIINFLLMGLMVYLIYRVLLTMPVSKYLRWMMLSWVVLMVFNANNLEFLGPEHGMPLYAYFMGILTLSLLLQFDKWKTYIWYKKYLYHALFIVCLFVTTFTWSIGLFVPILVILLLFLQRYYKYFFFYLLLFCVVLGTYYIIIFTNETIVRNTPSQYKTFGNYIKFLFSMFATPASALNGETLHPYQIIMVYIRGSFVMGLTIWAFYISKLFHVLNVKKYLTGRIQFEKWEIFFLGLLIWTFIIMMEIVIMRYYDMAPNAFYGQTFFFRRYYFHFYMFGIPLFIFIAMYVKKINVSYIKGALAALGILYVSFILIPYNNALYGYFYNGINLTSLKVVMNAKHVDRIDGVNNYAQFWQLGGHHMWQKQLMNRNVIKSTNQNSAWFIQDKPCGTCLLFMETFQYEQGEFGVVPPSMKKMNTIHFKSVGRFPYYISNTVFISDETGKIVGLGLKEIHIVQQITPFNMLQYWNATYDMEGFFYNYGSTKQHQYTLWAIAYNRRTISKLLTFTLKPTSKSQIHIWRSPHMWD